jgi:hypothetical protein
MDGSLLVSLRSHESSKHVIGRITDDWKMDISHTFDHTHQQKWVSKTVHFTDDDDDSRSLFCFANDENGSVRTKAYTGIKGHPITLLRLHPL